jgi:hypothetical protein
MESLLNRRGDVARRVTSLSEAYGGAHVPGGATMPVVAYRWTLRKLYTPGRRDASEIPDRIAETLTMRSLPPGQCPDQSL